MKPPCARARGPFIIRFNIRLNIMPFPSFSVVDPVEINLLPDFMERGHPRSRLRVTRACDRCKKRKIRCSGLQPCETCVECSHPCAYNAPYTRGRHPPQIRKSQNTVEHACDPEGTPTASSSHQELPGTPQNVIVFPSNLVSDCEPTRQQCRPPVELAQTDLDGHYLGPACEPSFLLRVQRALNPSVSFLHVSLPFSLSDHALPLPDFPPDCMIAREDASQLVQVFFDHAMPIGQFLHRPTVETWIAEFQDPSKETQSVSRPRQALLYTLFAIALQHTDSAPGDANNTTSRRHFATAELLLSQQKSCINLIAIQARLCQCIWLLGESRIDQCWDLLGVAARYALAIGLHRASCAHQAPVYDPLTVESSRRTFWCLYSLDISLSISLGRPRTFNDLDIDQEFSYPGEKSDEFEDQTLLPLGCARPAALATVAYFRLSWITGKVLRDFYSNHAPSINDQIILATRHSQSLKDWRDEFHDILSAEDLNTVPLSPLLQLQSNILNLSYLHTTILINRLFVLERLASSQTASECYSGTEEEREVNSRVGTCVTASSNITNILSNDDDAERMIRTFWFMPFIALSAITVLYSYTACQGSRAEPDRDYLSDAARCQMLLLSLVKEDSLVAKYSLALEDLRSQI